jgi:ribosomal protein S18 acetylase RimI-like enzyme
MSATTRATARATELLPVVPITAALAASFRACLDTVAREKRFLAQVEAPPLDRVQQFVADGLEKDAVQFVALDGERVVGWADIFPAWAHAVAHRGHVGMGVHPDYRGRSIGTRLLSACLAKATAQGLTRIELEVRADNAHAIHLYRKLGFTEEGRLRHGMRIEGIYFDTLLMALLHEAGTGRAG